MFGSNMKSMEAVFWSFTNSISYLNEPNWLVTVVRLVIIFFKYRAAVVAKW